MFAHSSAESKSSVLIVCFVNYFENLTDKLLWTFNFLRF